MIVLNESDMQSSHLHKLILIVAFKEKASAVAEHVWFDDEDIGYCGWNDFIVFVLGCFAYRVNRLKRFRLLETEHRTVESEREQSNSEHEQERTHPTASQLLFVISTN